MPEPTKIPRPFADSGDKNTIPDSSGSIGFASWQEGFPAITSEPFSQGGVAPKRADFNGIFNALSLATIWQQQGGFYAYDATTDYEVGNVVEYNNDLYKCITANGPSSAVKAPTDTTVWSKVMTAADVAALYLPLSCTSPITGTIFRETTHARGGTEVYATTDSIPFAVRDANGKNWFRFIVTQSYASASDYNSMVGLYLYNPTNPSQNANVANITVGYNQDGAYTRAPTPTTTDNSTKIATTAFVNSRLPYTSGTWTPTCYGTTTAGSTTISNNNCSYVKIGRLVIAYVSFSFTVTASSTGQVRIGGLPFSSTINAYGEFWSSEHSGFILTATGTAMYVRGINNNIPYLVSWGTAWDNTVNSTGAVQGSVVYYTA